MSKAHYHDPIVPPVSTSGASKRLDALSFALGAADRIRAFSPARVRGNAFPPKPVDFALVKSEKQAAPAPKPRLPLGKRPVMTMKRFTIILFDAAVTTAAMALAIIFAIPAQDALANLPAYALAILPFLVVSFFVSQASGLYRGRWRFASVPDLINILRAAFIVSLIAVFVSAALAYEGITERVLIGPRAAFLFFAFQVLLLGGPRFAYRYWKSIRPMRLAAQDAARNALVIGRPSEVETIMRALELKPLAGTRLIGAITGQENVGDVIRGVHCLGTLEDIDDVVSNLAANGKKVHRLIVASSALGGDAKTDDLLTKAHRLGLPLLKFQNFQEAGQQGGVAPLDIESMLLRDSVTIDHSRLAQLVQLKRIAVTGGGGSIGSEIVTRVAALGASDVLIIENSEPSLHTVSESLQQLGSESRIHCEIADVRDRERMFHILKEFKPDIVVHAAALKHVPYLERDWTEAIKTNVFGSINVMDAALAASARAVVTISTDKATYPVSVLGVTKRISELYAQYLDGKQSQTRFIAVRFGNVLASNGSVIPKFRAQIAAGGPVTVTDPRMVRYFMTIREASELVLTAASHSISARLNEFSPKASLYILKMGQPVRILDLAKKLISLAGFEPDVDIPIKITGIRPGERLNEALFTADEPSVQTGIDGISAATGAGIPEAQLLDGLEQLRLASITHDKVQAEKGFETLVPTYAHRHDPMGHVVPLEMPAA